MDTQAIRKLLQRLGSLERLSVRYRQGVVTDDSPLSVALGGSTVPYVGVRSLASVNVGDTVAVLTFGNDLLVLGALGASQIRYGTSSVTFAASVDSAVTTVTHGLGRVPKAITFGSNNGSTVFVWSNKTATTFDLTGKFDAVVTGTAVTDWIAIG